MIEREEREREREGGGRGRGRGRERERDHNSHISHETVLSSNACTYIHTYIIKITII